MTVYSVIFKAISPLTKIPDSQSIFGAFCYTYKNLYTEEKLESLLKMEKSARPFFLISSMFLKDTLPIPFDFVPEYGNSLPELKDTLKFKKIKKIKYFSKKIFKRYQLNKSDFKKNFYNRLGSEYKVIDEVLMLKDEEIHYSDCIKYDIRVRNNTSESELFQDKIMYTSENTFFEFYLRVNDENIENGKEVKEEIKNTIKNMKYITIGGMKSIGYNLFDYKSINFESDIVSVNPSVLISKAIGDKSIILDNSYYRINISNAKFNSKIKLYCKEAVCFIEGSVLETKKDYIGEIIVQNDGNKDNYRNLLGFLI